MPPHNGRTGRIGETLHHTFVVVKAVLDRPFLTAFDVPANVAAAFRIDRSACLEARHAARECRALKGMTRTQIALGPEHPRYRSALE